MIDLKKPLNEITSSSIQLATVSNGSFAHAMQIKRYINLGHDAINEIRSNKSLNEKLPELFKLAESV